jgi:hypothetical protein
VGEIGLVIPICDVLAPDRSTYGRRLRRPVADDVVVRIVE